MKKNDWAAYQKQWDQANLELEPIRQRELQEMDTQQAIRQLTGAINWACKNAEPTQTSGLVEWVKLMRGFEEWKKNR
ncbi:MAG: hypothetical protein SFY68_15885 [Candidatus Sumerlaeia bacterium]|nr:hypothetical protein [Candidatus Sumerlaeia bacterium]